MCERIDYSLSSETSFVPFFTCMTSLWTESNIIPNLLNEVSIIPIRCSNSSLIWPAQADKRIGFLLKSRLTHTQQEFDWPVIVTPLKIQLNNLYLLSNTLLIRSLFFEYYLCHSNFIRNLHRWSEPETELHLRMWLLEVLEICIWLSSRAWLIGGKQAIFFTEFSRSWDLCRDNINISNNLGDRLKQTFEWESSD